MGSWTGAVLAEAAGATVAEVVTDRELLAAYTAGDQDAFAALVRRHAPLVLGVCRRAMADRHAAEDAAQETFLTLARKAAGGNWRSSVANWLHAAALRVARNARKSAGRRWAREWRAAVPEAVEPIDRMTGRELLAALDEELARLPEKYRGPLILCQLEGLAYEEAAARIGVSEGVLRGRLQRGRRRLADALSRRGLAAAGGLAALTAVGRGGAASLADGVIAALAAVPRAAPAGRWAVAVALGCVAVTAWAAGVPGGQPAAPAEPAPVKKAGPNVTGRVLRPDGKPAAGAAIYGEDRDGKPRRVGTAGRDGRFAVRVLRRRPYWDTKLAASLPGCGAEWLTLPPPARGKSDTHDVTIRLPEEVPIRGKVVNLEGRPVAGVAVRVREVVVPLRGFDEFLTDMPQFGFPAPRPHGPPVTRSLHVDSGPRGLAARAVTGRDGRFTLRGVGEGRYVMLDFAGGGVARTRAAVVTWKDFDPEKYRKPKRRGAHMALPPGLPPLGPMRPDATYPLARGRVITGTFSDAATGDPVNGCSIGYLGTFLESHFVKARGAVYRLDGLPKAHQGTYHLNVLPPAGSDYLRQVLDVPAGDDLGPIRRPVLMRRGTVVKGRLIDAASGRGVAGVVQIIPAEDNKSVGRDGYPPTPLASPNARAGEDGTFRLVAVPGKSTLYAVGPQCERIGKDFLNPYRRAVMSEGKSVIEIAAAVRPLNLKPASTAKLTLRLNRGVTAELRVVDEAGKPLTGARVIGLEDTSAKPVRLPGSRATVYALGPDRPRELLLFHYGRHLFGRLKVRAGAKTVVARLRPTGTVTGRLLDADGRPLSKVRVGVHTDDSRWVDLYYKDHPGGLTATADGEGRFRMPGVIPGVKFTLRHRLPNRAPKSLAHGLEVKSGRPLNVGDLRTK